MEEYAIEVNHLTKIYKLYNKQSDRIKEAFSIKKKCYHQDFYALKDVNFKVKRGEAPWYCRKKWLWEMNDFKDNHRCTVTDRG